MGGACAAHALAPSGARVLILEQGRQLPEHPNNRDARAINLKLNELIRALDKARDQMIDIENLSDLELDELQARYEAIRRECLAREQRGQPQVGS